MDDTRYDQRDQRVETQINADTIYVHPPVTPAEGQGAATPSTSVTGTADVDTVTGGKAAGVLIETQNNYYPAHATPTLQPTTRGRIHGNPPTLSAAFTGREQTLDDLHAMLHSENAALTPPDAPVLRRPVPPRAALQGLGGIGKTQTALAYLYQHQNDYADLFWAIGETPEQLASQLAAFAPTLNPPIPVQADQNAVLQQVKQWFATHDNWLIVVDNAENLSNLKTHLPPLNRGRLLLTTRDVATSGLAKRLELDRLDEDNGALLLLRRADATKANALLADFTPQQQADARAISRDVDGLPLALDQAGAYIETRQITPARYRELYQQRHETLHRDYDNPDHASVAITFDLALKQVEQVPTYGPAAAQFVRLCAFLAPDAIPTEIFILGASKLDEPLASLAKEVGGFEDVYATACRYALLRHDAEPSAFTMHRLAQEVVRESLSAAAQQEMRRQVVQAVSAAFPWPDYSMWPQCERLLPHALLCYAYVTTHQLRTPEAATLLDNTAWYLKERARYKEAEPLYQEMLTIYKQVHGPEHGRVADALGYLGLIYNRMGRYDEAASFLEESVTISRTAYGEDDADYAGCLVYLADVYANTQRYAEAEPRYEQARDILRRAHGERHPRVAISLNNLANVYAEMQRYAEAEPLLEEALAIVRATLVEDDPGYATCLFSLGALYVQWGRFDEAEPLLQQALTFREHALGRQHPDVASCHHWLGELRYRQGDRAAAVDHFGQALAIQERTLGPHHPDTVNTRAWLATAEAE